MTSDQVKSCIKLLAGLFPSQVTQEHAKLLTEAFAPLSADAVTKGIKAHRVSPELDKGFWNLGKLIEGCRAAEHELKQVTNTSAREGSWCDVYRRQNPQLGDCGDVETIVRVHRGWWNKCRQSDRWRQKLSTACRQLLMLSGLPEAKVDAWLPYVFDATPEDFRQALADLRNNQPGAQRELSDCPV